MVRAGADTARGQTGPPLGPGTECRGYQGSGLRPGQLSYSAQLRPVPRCAACFNTPSMAPISDQTTVYLARRAYRLSDIRFRPSPEDRRSGCRIRLMAFRNSASRVAVSGAGRLL
jgi:hypothetical protein